MNDYAYEKFLEYHYEHCTLCKDREQATPPSKIFWIEDCPAYKKELEEADKQIKEYEEDREDREYDSWKDSTL